MTDLLPTGRQEQSVASLAQWAAKGAHLLGLELGLGAGDRIGLDAVPGWPAATVLLAAWWAGIGVQLAGTTTPTDEPAVWVVHTAHTGRSTPRRGEVFWLGDGIDGAPAAAISDALGEPWTHAVQPFPDQPPPPGATPDAPAVVGTGATGTQQELLRLATSFAADGPVGLDLGDDAADAVQDLALLCLRPLVTGHATVVLRDVGRSAADGDRVARWR